MAGRRLGRRNEVDRFGMLGLRRRGGSAGSQAFLMVALISTQRPGVWRRCGAGLGAVGVRHNIDWEAAAILGLERLGCGRAEIESKVGWGNSPMESVLQLAKAFPDDKSCLADRIVPGCLLCGHVCVPAVRGSN